MPAVSHIHAGVSYLKLFHLLSIFKENSISDSAADMSSLDILPDDDDDIHNQTFSGLFQLERL